MKKREIKRCKTCGHHNGGIYEFSAEKWCTKNHRPTDVRDGCDQHTEVAEPQASENSREKGLDGEG